MIRPYKDYMIFEPYRGKRIVGKEAVEHLKNILKINVNVQDSDEYYYIKKY